MLIRFIKNIFRGAYWPLSQRCKCAAINVTRRIVRTLRNRMCIVPRSENDFEAENEKMGRIYFCVEKTQHGCLHCARYDTGDTGQGISSAIIRVEQLAITCQIVKSCSVMFSQVKFNPWPRLAPRSIHPRAHLDLAPCSSPP